MAAKFKFLVFALSLISLKAGAATCSFDVSHGQIRSSYFGFNVMDQGQVMDKRWFYPTSESEFAINNSCNDAIKALQTFEKSNFCEANWTDVKAKIMGEFNTIESRPYVAGCLRSIEKTETALNQPFLMPNEIIALRKKLVARIGDKAVAVMTDRQVADQVAILQLK